MHSLLDDGELLPLSQAARLGIFCRGGRQPRRETIYRWAIRGCRGIKLETLRMPAGLATTEAAGRRFLSRLNSENEVHQRSESSRPPRPSEASVDEQLDAEGL